MSNTYDGLPQMSGALPDNHPSPNILSTIDHVYSEKGDGVSPQTESGSILEDYEIFMPVVNNNRQDSLSSFAGVIAQENQAWRVAASIPEPIIIRARAVRRKSTRKPSLDDVLRHAVNGSV